MTTVMNRAVRELIGAGKLAHLVTLNEDGSPQVTIVWGLGGDEIVSGHLGAWKKVGNLRRDPRVVLSIEADHRNDVGLNEYVVVTGRARVSGGGAPDFPPAVGPRLLSRPGCQVPADGQPTAWVVLHITRRRSVGSVRAATGEVSAAVTPFQDIPFPGPGGRGQPEPPRGLAEASVPIHLQITISGAVQRGKVGRRRLFAQPPGQILEAATECTLG